MSEPRNLNEFDDLDDMSVPQTTQSHDTPSSHGVDDEDIKVASRRQKATASGGKTYPHSKAAKRAAERAKNVQIVLVIAISFVVLLALIIGVGIAMSRRAGTIGPENTTSQTTKLTPAEGKTAFVNSSNRPELSEEGVKGLITEAYYTEDDSLAVTLSLSNGTATAQRVSRLKLRVFNNDGDTIAERDFDSFDPAIVVQSGQYGSAYLVIPSGYVIIKDDPLSRIGSTLEISAEAV